MRFSWFLRHCYSHKKKTTGRECKYRGYKNFIDSWGDMDYKHGCKCIKGKIITSVQEAQRVCKMGVDFVDPPNRRKKLVGLLRGL